MSQKVQILGVRHSGGSVYLGEDSNGNPQWTRDAHRIMDWLCDGWRYRFNQHRAHRPQRKLVKVLDSIDDFWIETPLGGSDVPKPLTDKNARLTHSWLRAIPTDVLKSPKEIENSEWFSSLKRRAKHGGQVPGFRSRNDSPQSFVCWRNGSQVGNAILKQTGKRTGVVTVTGLTPRDVVKPGSKGKWNLRIRVRLTEVIRPYSSVIVNWTARTLSFTNVPQQTNRRSTGSVVGIDRGVVHTLTTSNSEHIDITKESPDACSKYVQLQRKLARQDRANEVRGGRDAKFSSNRRKRTVAELKRIAGKEARRRHDWIHQTTTTLVRDHDFIALEDLRVSKMVRKGGGRKRGLNRVILRQSWSGFLIALQYKAKLAGVEVVLVNPAYTSQACSACGHTAKENRESQAIFKCVECGYEANADVNAALNILERGLESGQGNGLGHGGMVRPRGVSTPGGTPSEVSTFALAGGPSGSLVQSKTS